MQSHRSRGVGTIHAVVGCAIVALVAAGGISTRSWWTARFAVSSLDGPMLSSGASAALMRARITPESLAAAGVTSEETTALLARAATWWGDNGAACAASCAAIDGAGISVDALRRKAQSGLASEGDLTALSAAVAAMNSARSTHDEKLDAYWAAATNGLEGDKVAKLLAYRDNADAAIRLPTAYLVVTRDESDATALRDALSEVATNGEGAASAAQTIVTTADGNGAVSAAKAYLTNNLGGITTAWTSAISG
jgi:hypothetical protein